MNLNDLRAQAYGKKADSDQNKKSDNKPGEVKPFLPQRMTKQEAAPDLLGASEVRNPSTPEIKTFVPKSFVSSEKKIQESVNGFEASQSDKNQNPQFIKATEKNYSNQLNNATDFLKTGGLIKVPVEEPQPDGKDSVYRRVAKFLLLIGENEAAKILPHLSEKQIERIIPEIASIRTVSKEEASVILAEFHELLEKARQSGGVETAREMLQKAYGKKRADEMIKKAMPLEGKKPFDYLNDADTERIYLLIKDENVGIQSLVLSHLVPQKAAAVINQMTSEEKKEVVLRLAKMEPVSPDLIRRVDQAMHEKSLNQTTEKAENIDGRNALAQILKKMDMGAENDILTYLSEDDPDLGQDLRTRLFTMDDVVNADDKIVQQQLRLMSEPDIAYLIAAKPDDFRDKILDNVSSARRTEILAQEDILKPMKRSDCERITAQFFSILRREYESGHLIIKGRNDDVFV